MLYTLVRSEAKGQDFKRAPHFIEWQTACAKGTQAYEVLKSVSPSFIQGAIGKEALQILEERASKHEVILQRQNHSRVNLTEELKERLEPLLYCLFPDGPTRRDHYGLRFGRKCSLSIVCNGEKRGLFCNFETREKGGPLKLIQNVSNLNASEAREWAKNFLGLPQEMKAPSSFRFNQPSQKAQEWNSLKPDPTYPAPPLKGLPFPLSQKYHESARHAYLDEKGNLLFYVLRLLIKKIQQRKI